VIEVENQSMVGTKIFFFAEFSRKEGIVKTIKFSNKDPLMFVVMLTHKVVFYRINPEL